jgi:Zn-dependent membrane protease YugP
MHFPIWFYGGPIDPVYGLLLPGIAFVFALLAQARVKSAFGRFEKVTTRSGLTGAEVAELLLRSRGIADVSVEATHGFLSDHYDPRSKTLRLSAAVHGGRSVSALGVAAHETGHALQHADGYAWLTLRSNIVPVVSFMSRIGSWLLPLGLLLTWGTYHGGGPASPMGLGLLYAAAIGLAAVVVFSLVTLPVEIDASQRAMRLLDGAGVLVGAEVDGARTVLRAAAWTYVASAAAAIVQLLHVLSLIRMAGGRDRNSR